MTLEFPLHLRHLTLEFPLHPNHLDAELDYGLLQLAPTVLRDLSAAAELLANYIYDMPNV